jgi:MoaA/NifB/PqqE/SkfB family radical SAM enzyme
MLTLDKIRRAHVELTTRCNARCPMCMRNYRGMDFNSGYPVCELSLAQFQHIFTPEVLSDMTQPEPEINGRRPVSYGFSTGISFNGNLGDFSSAKDGLEIVKYLVNHAVPVMITTNGSARTPDWWAQFALPGVKIGFALDGLEDTHSLYRQDTDWHKIIKNAQAFIAAGGCAVWRFIPFDHNRHQEQACKSLAQELGFAKFENIYDGRDNGPVFTRTGEFSHQIGNDPGFNGTPRDIKPLLENHVTWYNSKTFKEAKDTPELNIQCIHKRNREIYVAADGSVYPCCFLGFYPGQMNHPGNQELATLVHQNNALEYPLAQCLEWFDRVEQTWQLNSIAEGRTFQCVKTCNKI